MNYREYVTGPWPQRKGPDGVPSLFTRLVNAIFHEDAVLIVKHQRSKRETDSAVLALVVAVLTWVPLVPHLYIHIVLPLTVAVKHAAYRGGHAV